MKNDVVNLINFIKDKDNPLLIANKISYFISDALREKKTNLYEAYLLNWEEIRFRRMSYIESGWNGRVRISTCLAILNQRMLAQVFQDNVAANKLKDWALEALNLNGEKREHYILDRYNTFLDANNSHELLKELLEIRNNYQSLSDNEGPYHNEVFPYHFYSPEKILLDCDGSTYEQIVDEEIENLIIELNLK